MKKIILILITTIIFLSSCKEPTLNQASSNTVNESKPNTPKASVSPESTAKSFEKASMQFDVTAIDNRKVRYKFNELDFLDPMDYRHISTGELVLSDPGGDVGRPIHMFSNIYLVNDPNVDKSDLRIVKQIFDSEKIEKIRISVNREDRSLVWAKNPLPVNQGHQIIFLTNKDTIQLYPDKLDLHIMNIDGSGEKVLMEGKDYPGILQLLDTVNNEIIAYSTNPNSGKSSLYVINSANGEVKQEDITGLQLDSLSKNGSAVLLRKKEDSLTTDIIVINLASGEEKIVGKMADDYYFYQIHKEG